MKIVLKDADFSQSGIPTPHEVIFDGSKIYNVFTGNLDNNSNTQRGADVNSIPVSNKKITNNSNVIFAFVLFYSSDNTYLGCASRDGEQTNIIIGDGGTARIDQMAHYMKPVDATHMTEMSAEEVVTLKANMAYWKLGVQVTTGTIDDASIELEIVE